MDLDSTKHFIRLSLFTFLIHLFLILISYQTVQKIINDRESDHIEEGLLQSGNSDRKGNCLARDRWRDRLALMSCSTSPLSPALWKFNFNKGMLFSSGVISTHFGAICMTYNNNKQNNESQSDRNSKVHLKFLNRTQQMLIYTLQVLLGSCSKYGYRVLRFAHVDHTLKRLQPLSQVIVPSEQPNSSLQAIPSSSFTCPVTSLALPINLDSHLTNSTNSRQQVLVGGGAYTKVNHSFRQVLDILTPSFPIRRFTACGSTSIRWAGTWKQKLLAMMKFCSPLGACRCRSCRLPRPSSRHCPPRALSTARC